MAERGYPRNDTIDCNPNSRIVVIESCWDCRAHQWNTRHDQAKYLAYADEVAASIKSRYPGAQVLFN